MQNAINEIIKFLEDMPGGLKGWVILAVMFLYGGYKTVWAFRKGKVEDKIISAQGSAVDNLQKVIDAQAKEIKKLQSEKKELQRIVDEGISNAVRHYQSMTNKKGKP